MRRCHRGRSTFVERREGERGMGRGHGVPPERVQLGVMLSASELAESRCAGYQHANATRSFVPQVDTPLVSPALTSSDSSVDILPMETPRGTVLSYRPPRGVGLSVIGRRRRRDGQTPLADGQGANHPRLFVPGDVAVVLVDASRGIDRRFLGGPRRDVDADAELVDLEVVRRRPCVGQAHVTSVSAGMVSSAGSK